MNDFLHADITDSSEKNSIVFPYVTLVQELKEALLGQNLKVENFIYRISMQSDLLRVKKHGSSRVGLSDKQWDKINEFQPFSAELIQALQGHSTIRHDQVVIGSEWQDLQEDCVCVNGTLKHKLTIYEKPFFTLYHKDKLLEIGRESPESENNQGRHYFFLDSPEITLHSLWQIHAAQTHYFLEQIQ